MIPTPSELAFLRRLVAGVDFADAVTSCGVGVAFNCIMNGWVDRGELTPAGRAVAQAGPPATDPAVKRNAARLLVALYRVAKGTPGIVVPESEVWAEVKREALFDLTESQFEDYRRRAIDEVKAHKGASP